MAEIVDRRAASKPDVLVTAVEAEIDRLWHEWLREQQAADVTWPPSSRAAFAGGWAARGRTDG